MASLKTVEYCFPHLATAADAVDTNFTQITIYLPENSKVFKSVYVQIMAYDAQTTSTNVTARNLDIQLGAAGYTSIDNANTLSHSSEQFGLSYGQDFTSYFTTNWTGTSMTMDCRININTSALGCVNLNSIVTITYEYDETTTTHVKTVYIPLNAPITALAATKPGTATATIPNLDTYCPEASKTFRQTSLIIQGNLETVATADISLSYEIDTAGVFTSQLFELGLASSAFYRIVNNISFTTNATHNFYIWGSATDFDHPQVWMQVTYEFNSSTTTTVLNSLILPMEFDGNMGPSAANFNRATRELWIQEPTTITVQTCALFVFYEQYGAIASLNARIGTGSFSNYSSVATTATGSMALMIRNDSISLARGRNTLSADIYKIDTSDSGASLSSFWMINYHSGKSSSGVSSHNHTVKWNIIPTNTVAASIDIVSANKTLTIPESNYFVTSIGGELVYDTSSTLPSGGSFVGVERLASGEGGLKWENAYESSTSAEPEIGIRFCYFQARDVFNRWDGDVDSKRLNLETSRRWRTAQAVVSFFQIQAIFTYHTITKTVSGNITNSNGGTVTIDLHRVATGEKVKSTSRVGNGAFSITWYDDTEEVYVSAREDDTYKGRSADGLAT